mgnify:FL=1
MVNVQNVYIRYMKITCVLSILLVFCNSLVIGQNYLPIPSTHYNFDAVAETTPALGTTSGAIDGSDFVMFSQNYASLFSMNLGLPNNGLISNPSRTFQLQAYNQNNILYLTAGQSDSILLINPASYNAISVLGFATEGNATMNVIVRFTDNTTQTFNAVSVLDWFSGSGSVFGLFGRAGRTSGTIVNPPNGPHLYPHGFILNCANRTKLLKSVIFQNTGANPRLCLMAISGNSGPFSTLAQGSPVTCTGGTNGSATLTPSGGISPYTYTWSTLPVQNSSVAVNLTQGVYTYTVTESGGCSNTGSISITQSNSPIAPLFVSSNGTTVCSGNTLALAASGANSYTWNTGSNAQLIIVSPTASAVYTVCGPNLNNCIASGSIYIQVLMPPQISLANLLSGHCTNSPGYTLSMLPGPGILTGPAIQNFSVFQPSLMPPGTTSVGFSYTASNGCSAFITYTTQIFSLPQVSVALSPSIFCTSGSSVNLSPYGFPSGGNFSGNGIMAGIFSPSLAGIGTHVFNYSYSDANGCVNSSTTAVQVQSLASPSMSINKTFYCMNAPTVTLVGLPAGGQFAGPGLQPGGVFNPLLAGAGTHTMVYTLVSGPCQSSISKTVTVSTCADMTELSALIKHWYYNSAASTLEYESETQAEIELYTLEGKLLLKTSIEPGKGNFALPQLSRACFMLNYSDLNHTGTFQWCQD